MNQYDSKSLLCLLIHFYIIVISNSDEVYPILCMSSIIKIKLKIIINIDKNIELINGGTFKYTINIK